MHFLLTVGWVVGSPLTGRADLSAGVVAVDRGRYMD